MTFWNTLSPVVRGRLLIFTAAVLWSTSGAFVKSSPLPAETIAMNRCLIAGAVLFVFARYRGVAFRWRPATALMAAFFGLMNYSFIASMAHTTAANAIFLQYTAPAWIFLAGIIFLGEPLGKKNRWSLVGAMAGVGVLIAGEWSEDHQRSGILLGLLSGVAYAGVAVTMRFLRASDSLSLAVINHLAAGLGLLAVLWISQALGDGGGETLILKSGWDYLFLAVFGISQMALPYVLFGIGLQHVTAQEAALLTLAEPILNPVWTYLAAGESPSIATLLGGGVLLSTLAIRYFPAAGEPRPIPPNS